MASSSAALPRAAPFRSRHWPAGEEAAEGGGAEAGLALVERAEGDCEALPAVVVVVRGGGGSARSRRWARA